MSELRRDPATDDWVIIAPDRGRRPQPPTSPTSNPLGRFDPTCPFCPGNESLLPEILFERPGPERTGWCTRVVPNKFPAVSHEDASIAVLEGLQVHQPARGCHDVIIDGPRHDRDLIAMADDELLAVFATYRDQCARRMAQPEIQSLVLFRNRGTPAGASLGHPHAQLIALHTVPPHVRAREAAMQRYFAVQGRCLLCDLIASERIDGTRVVIESDRFLTVVPYAARVPFEMWLLPKRHAAVFHGCDDEEVAQLGLGLRDGLLRLHAQFDAIPYRLVCETATRVGAHAGSGHWFLRLVPHTAVAAGFELGSGLAINSSRPEDDAAALRASAVGRPAP